MKKFFTLMVGFFLIAMNALSAVPYVPISVNFEDEDPQFEINGKTLNTPIVRAFTFQGTNVWDPTSYNAYLSFGEDANVTNMVTTTGTCYSTYIDFQIGSNTFAHPVTHWYCSVMATKPSVAGSYSIGYGYLNIKPAPEVNANTSFFYTHAINGSEYGPFTGSFDDWPFALKGDYGGYVAISVFNATNVIFENRIKSNETDIANLKTTNSIIQSNLTAEISRATNSESIISNMVVSETSRATNSESIISNMVIDAQTSQATHTNKHILVAHPGAGTASTNATGDFDVAGAADAARNDITNSSAFINAMTNGVLVTSNGVYSLTYNVATRTWTLNVNTNTDARYLADTNSIIYSNTPSFTQATAKANAAVPTNDASYSLAVTNVTITGGSEFSTNRTGHNLAFVIPTNAPGVVTNEPASLYRYDAYPAVPNTIWVFATTTNITAVRSGSTFTFTIPTGTRLLSSKIRVDGGNTDSGSIYLVLGTNDMNNSSTVNNWIPVCNATRDDTYANIPVTAQTYSGDNSQIKISGLGAVGGIIYHVESRY